MWQRGLEKCMTILYSFFFQVDVVCHGGTRVLPDIDGSDPYAEPKRAGKFRTVKSGNDLTTEILVERILSRRLDFEARNKAKEKKEIAAFEALTKIQRENGTENVNGTETENGDC